MEDREFFYIIVFVSGGPKKGVGRSATDGWSQVIFLSCVLHICSTLLFTCVSVTFDFACSFFLPLRSLKDFFFVSGTSCICTVFRFFT